ncbi:MAG: hypothetical protein L0312_05015, partial [Acidobacteria bacterium]|nr:hypothetical protein [Acidobacteriota bacterium]
AFLEGEKALSLYFVVLSKRALEAPPTLRIGAGEVMMDTTRPFLIKLAVAILCTSSFALLLLQCFAWHEPHATMTRAAISSLPKAMRQTLGAEAENLSEVYCWYPDRYRNAGSLERTAMRVYCEKPDGKIIHNVTWRRQEDLESLEYLLNRIIAHIRQGEPTKAAQYAGTLAHLLEDSVSPAHAMDLKLVQDLLPPPPSHRKLHLHTAIEITAPEFDLGGRMPQQTGQSVAQAAERLLERCYAIIKDNRAHLLEMVRAVYADDEATMNRLRLRAARAGSELLADAYYTAFLLASGNPTDSSKTGVIDRQAAEPRSRANQWQLKLQSPGIEVQLGQVVKSEKQAEATDPLVQRQAALNLLFSLREVVRILGIDKRAQRTLLGNIHLIVPATDDPPPKGEEPDILMMGRWPPYNGSQALHLYLDDSGLLGRLMLAIDGMPHLNTQPIEKGQRLRTVDHRGDLLYETVLTEAGHLSIRNHDSGECLLNPSGSGFAQGTVVSCQGTQPLLVRVTEDENLRELRVNIGKKPPEIYRYRKLFGSELQRGNHVPQTTILNKPSREWQAPPC